MALVRAVLVPSTPCTVPRIFSLAVCLPMPYLTWFMLVASVQLLTVSSPALQKCFWLTDKLYGLPTCSKS